MKITARLALSAIVFAVPALASAHSAVSPVQTVASKYETFTLSVPTEKEIPTTSVRLLVPDGLSRVTPFVKPGWAITVTKDLDGDVTQVEWRGGVIPAGQKDVFLFTAKTPTEPTTLVWRAYQTYRDGTVVAWDQDPKAHEEGDDEGEEVTNPYSTTDVVSAVSPAVSERSGTANLPYLASFGALALSIAAIFLARHKA